jgi:hypothetical protein
VTGIRSENAEIDRKLIRFATLGCIAVVAKSSPPFLRVVALLERNQPFYLRFTLAALRLALRFGGLLRCVLVELVRDSFGKLLQGEQTPNWSLETWMTLWSWSNQQAKT